MAQPYWTRKSAEISGSTPFPFETERPAALGPRRSFHAMLLATTVLAAAQPGMRAHAQTAWTGANSTNWFDAGNWSAGVPTNAVNAEIDTVVNSLPSIEGGAAQTINTYVGLSANGVLTIQNGGSLSNDRGLIGQNANSSGAVAVIGGGASWTNSVYLIVGNLGQGSLSIVNGATVFSDEAYLGAGPNASGTATVTGANSVWTATGPFIVGDSGSATANIENGGKIDSSHVDIGYFQGSSGEINVTGDGSAWESSGILTIGRGGDALINIEDGGRIVSEHSFFADQAGSTAEAFIGGEGSEWITNGNFLIGMRGEGDVVVHSGGKVAATSSVIGFDDGSSGQMVVTDAGSAFSVSSGIHVGGSGTGLLVAAAGGVVQSDQGTLANTPDAIGNVLVTGNGSAWLNSGTLVVGNSGTAGLFVEDGGRVTSAGAEIANFSASEAGVSVTGAGSVWENAGSLAVGGEGTGTLGIQDGGRVSNGEATVAAEAGSIGTVIVRDFGSEWATAGDLFVGYRGSGALIVQQGGVVNAANGVIGAHSGALGSVTVTGAGSAWVNSGDMHVGGEGEARLTIANGALVEAGGTTFVGVVAGSNGTVSIGAATGLAPLAPGELKTQKISFGEGEGALVFNHTAADYLFAPVIEGAGTINALSGTTLLSADSGGFTGQASIDDGATLAVNGKLGGAVDVLSGGRLQGAGTVGSTQVAAGGTLAPGNSIGTLNVAGNITLEAGSVYEVEVNPAGTEADLVHATGTATLNGGTVTHVGLGGAYKPYKTYKIMAADSGVTGTFDDVTSDFAFLDPQLSYDPNSVFLTLVRNEVSYCDVGLTPNQCATGEGVQSLGLGNQLHDALVVLDEDTARSALDQLSGEIHASIRGAMLEDSRFVRDAALARVRAAFGEVAAPSVPVLSYNGEGAASAVADEERLAIWALAFGGWGQFEGDGNAASLDRDTGGILIGADALALEQWRIGVLAGYSRSTYDVDDRASSGESDNLHLGLYGGSRWGALGLRVGAAYTWQDIDVDRSVTFTGFADSLEAGYDAGTAQVFGELGYRVDVTPVSFEPFAALAHVNVDADAFTESGGAAALAAESSDTDATFTTLGIRAESGFTLHGIEVTAQGMLGWRHAFGDATPSAAFAFSGGDVFSIDGTPIAEDSAVVEAGLDFQVTSLATLGLSYNGQFGSGLSDHSAKANLAVRF